MKLHTNERGSALLISLCLLAMLTLIGLLALQNTNTEIDLAYNEAHSDKAFYIAEAGAKRAFVDINNDNDWRTGYHTVDFSGGDYSVRLTDSTADSALYDTVLIRSEGDFHQAVGVIELITVPTYLHPFTFAMFGKAGIAFDQNTCTDSYNSDSGSYATTALDSLGHVGTNGTVTSSKDVNFGGGISTATPGGITLGAHNTVNGDTSSTRDSVDVPDIPASEFTWAESVNAAQHGMSGSGYSYNNGSHTLVSGAYANIVLTSGVYYFSSIELGQGTTVSLAPGASVTIYVTGDITLHQGSTMNDGGSPSDLLIFSNGSSLQFDQNNKFYGAFYGPNAHVQYDQTTEVYGSLVANTLKLDQYACFHYDRNLAKIKKFKTGDMQMIAWREL